MNEYDLIYEELCERVECGELSLEDAEIINDVAYDRYVKEDMSDIERYNSDRIFNLHTGKNRRIAPDGSGYVTRRPKRNNFNSDAEFKDALAKYDHGKNAQSRRGYIGNQDVDGFDNANVYNTNVRNINNRVFRRISNHRNKYTN